MSLRELLSSTRLWRVWIALAVVSAFGLALGGTIDRAAAEEVGDEPPPCEDFRAFAEDYPSLEIIDCRGIQADSGPWSLHGLLSWDGQLAAFDGGAKEGIWFRWPLAKYQYGVCSALRGWLREQHGEVIGFESYQRGCFVEGYAFLGYDGTHPPFLEYFVHGVLAIDGEDWPSTRAYYDARLGHTLDVREVTIVAMEQEPSIAYTAPPDPPVPADPPPPPTPAPASPPPRTAPSPPR